MTPPLSLATAGAAPMGLTAEDRLHDDLLRLAGSGASFYVVHLQLARAAGTVAGLERMRRALRPFELLTSLYDARLFCLSEGHVLLVCHDGVPVDQVDIAVSKIRSGYLDTIEDWTLDCDEDPDADWYDSAQTEDLERLLSLTTAWAANARRRTAASPAHLPEAPPIRRLNAEELGSICQRIEQVDLSAVVRQQMAMDVRPDAASAPLFRETYVSMQNLRDLVAPGIDMFASSWLFRYLTGILDRRMLDFVAGQGLARGPVPISLNLNLTSLETPDFKQFLDIHHAMASKPIIEIQLVDLLANSRIFARVRQLFQAQGYKVLIDGLTPLTLQVIDVPALRSDFLKIWWREDVPTAFPARRVSGLREVFDQVGRERIILARVESEQALEWGVKHGIHRFQGRLVDRLLGALAGKSARNRALETAIGRGHAFRS